MFDTCAVGQCRNTDTSTCSPGNSRMKYCLRCNESSGDQTCSMCKAGYQLAPDNRNCTLINQTKTYNLFVKSTSELHKDSSSKSMKCNMAFKTVLADGISAFNNINAESPINPSPFLQHALRQI